MKASKVCTFVDMFHSVIGNGAGAEHCPKCLPLRLYIIRIVGSSTPFAIADVWNTRRRLVLLPDSGVCSCHFGCWYGRLARTPRRPLYWVCVFLLTPALVFPIISPLTLSERFLKNSSQYAVFDLTMTETSTWLIAGLLALSLYLDIVLARIDSVDAFCEVDKSLEGPEGPRVNDYHVEDQPGADEEGD